MDRRYHAFSDTTERFCAFPNHYHHMGFVGVKITFFWGQNLCNLRGCCWSPQSDTSVPWCFFSSDHGYRVEGELRETQQGEHRDPKSGFSLYLGVEFGVGLALGAPRVGLSFGLIRIWVGFGLISYFPQGFQATLTRLSSPSLFGDDINTVLLTAEYQTQNRFHFKVRFSQ
ncbi:hypothetical protein ASZ78_001178, partial [Callipepla squamata]